MARPIRSSGVVVNDATRLEANLTAAVNAIEEALRDAGLPGLVVGITDRARLRRVIVHGCEDLKTGEPLTAESRLAIGSISKSFTAIALLQLAAEGRVNLHAPITDYLPELTLSSPYNPITAHHLLTHTSGLPNYLIHAASSRYAIAALREYAPSYAPGTHWWYSNTGYQLLGYVLEKIEGLPYHAIVRRRILQPLELRSTSAILDDAQRTKIATSYTRWPYDGTYLEAPWFEYSAADGSLVSTVPDLCTYARLLLNRGVGPNGRLLRNADFIKLTRPVLNDYGYGLTVKRIGGNTVIGHGGGIAGFRSWLEVHPEEGFGFALLCASPIEVDLLKWITDTMAAAFAQARFSAVPARSTTWEGDIQDYVGVYRTVPADAQASGRALEIVALGGHLALKEASTLRPLQTMGRDCFRIADADSSEPPLFFGRAGGAETDERVVEVSQGTQWYVSKAFSNEIQPAPPSDYSAYVGHFEYSGPEGPVARVFVRNGRLWVVFALNEAVAPEPLEPIEVGVFRFSEPDFNPERIQFDTVIDGQALRMTFSGVPLYRRDTP